MKRDSEAEETIKTERKRRRERERERRNPGVVCIRACMHKYVRDVREPRATFPRAHATIQDGQKVANFALGAHQLFRRVLDFSSTIPRTSHGSKRAAPFKRDENENVCRGDAYVLVTDDRTTFR